MRILLIGASGQLGTELKKVLQQEELFCPNLNDLDVANFNQTKDYILNIGPDLIINTAAFHQVDQCEQAPERAFLLNALSVNNLAEICCKLDIPLVHYSTDYVFGLDTKRKTPYTEEDTTGPVNVYGISKLVGENFIRAVLKKYFIIRPAGLFGVAGSEGKGGNFIETMLKIAKEKGQVKVKNDEFTTPTYAKEVAQKTAQLIKTEFYGTYHMTSEGECSWYDFAKKIFELTGTSVDCQPVSSSEMLTIAKRPSYSVLENKNLKDKGFSTLSHWQNALEAYLEEKDYLKNKKTQKDMEKQKTKIEGLEVVPLLVNFDDRGWLFEIIHNYDIPKFGQVYAIGDPAKGIIRAFHKHTQLWDYFCIIKGSAKFVFVDDRPESPSYQQQEIIVVSEKVPKMIIVPPGIFHGWMSLEDNTFLISTASEVYNKENPDETRISPDSFGDVWVIKGK